jgi:hypothetical protein
VRQHRLAQQPDGPSLCHGGGRASGSRPYTRLQTGMLLGGLALARTAWGARGTAFRGQWTLGNLIGSLAILGVLVALVLVLVWPRRGGN